MGFFNSRGLDWLIEKENEEDWEHPLKTEERLDEVIQLSGASRVLFSTLVKYSWIPLTWKALVFCLANEEREGEHPHSTVGQLICGRYLDVFRV